MWRGIRAKIYKTFSRDVVLPGMFRVAGLNLAEEMRRLNDEFQLPVSESTELQLYRLKRIVSEAAKTPFYRNKFREAKVEPCDLQSIRDLQHFPLLTKEDLRAHDIATMTTRSPRIMFQAETAGTSGTPVKVKFDVAGRARQLVRRWTCFSAHGIRPGDREARFWGRPGSVSKRLLYGMATNRSVFGLFEAGQIETQRELSRLRRFSPDYLYGYTSLILAAAECSEALRMELGLKAVVCTAEQLLPSQHEFISKAFGCPVIVEYGCSEVDIIAVSCPRGQLHVISPDILLETLPVASAVCADADANDVGEVIVTDLRNTLMPMLRYQLGDLVSVAGVKCGCGWAGPVLDSLQGRTSEQLLVLPSGKQMHGVLFAHAFEALANRGMKFTRFLVVQEENSHLSVFVQGVANSQVEKVQAWVRQELRARIPEQMPVDVQCCDIPVNPQGKFSYFLRASKSPVALENGGVL